MEKVSKQIKSWLTNNLSWLILAVTGLVCVIFMIAGTASEDGSITLDGQNSITTNIGKEQE